MKKRAAKQRRAHSFYQAWEANDSHLLGLTAQVVNDRPLIRQNLKR
jgi:hypothetical protein